MNVSRRGGRTPRGKNQKTKGANPREKPDLWHRTRNAAHLPRRRRAGLAAHFGTRVSHTGGGYDTREIPDGTGRVWKVVKDASIAGAEAHASCGIHVHVGVGEHTPKTLRNLVNIVNAKEDLLTMALEIRPERRRQWCRPVDPDFLRRLNAKKPKTMEALAQLWYNDRDWRYHAHEHYDNSRYHLLNLHSVFQKGTIEFRAFNSTLHAGKVKAYIQLCLAISYQALTAGSASPRRPVTDNPKYTFRCWLLRLGFIGDEFKTAREHLTKALPGNSAWRLAS